MTMLAEIERLSVAERIQLIDEIWVSIATTPDALPLTTEQKELLDERLGAMERNPAEVMTWTQVKANLIKS